MSIQHANDVRFAVPEDTDALWELIHVLWRDEHKDHHPINEAAVRQRLAYATNRTGSFIGVIGPVGGPLRAMIYLILETIWFSTEPQITCVTAFVHPQWRKSDYARQLLNFAKSASDELQARLLTGVVSTERTKMKCALWARHFPKAGEFYLYDPTEQGLR